MPTRAEDVLKSAGATAASTGSTWWSRQGTGGGVTPSRPVGPATPPVTPITGGTLASGLPVRVPMAQLPQAADAPTVPFTPPPRVEPDPEAVGNMLTKFYGGVRRAEAEDNVEVNREARTQ